MNHEDENDDFSDIDFSEEALEQMDREFLANIEEKNVNHAQCDAEDQTAFWLLIAFLILFTVGMCFAVYWVVQGRRIRYRRRYDPNQTYVPTKIVELVEV